jgi:protein-L-isoaspartate(D-aspartate) O-methyltransferase
MRNRIIYANLVTALLALLLLPAGSPAADFEEERSELVKELIVQFKRHEPAGIKDPSQDVVRAMLETRRHEFVPDDLEDEAYENRPLPIGFGQTISQPFIVMLMTELLKPESGNKVLEVGTGSGYQAAVLSQIVDHVHSIEIIPELAEQARNKMDRLGYGNVTVVHGDGYYGIPEHAPYDSIIVTAAAGHVPPPLVDQLAPGGRMAIPVGQPFMTQQLMLVEKDMSGETTTRSILPVAFVPLTGGH